MANAQHVRNVPGHKSDVNDATWIADLLAHGLIASSFVPPRPIRELRDLTRTRWQAVGEVVRHQHRIEKVLQDANIELSASSGSRVGSVWADWGLGGQAFGRSPETTLRLRSHGSAFFRRAQRRSRMARSATPKGLVLDRREQTKALTGRLSEHHRYLLGWHLRLLDSLVSG